MRLHRLAFTAVGPFAGTEVIDFTAFDDAGLFLLAGPTGAGKSTLIDAIVFALYGDVARQSDASTDRLRSDYAPPRVRSEVDLIFETGAGLYRVTRTPKYVPKGNKSARNSQASLVRVVEDPSSPEGYRTVEGVERGARQISSEIKRIIGLTKEQFLQTVVLPQGKFAEFLTAKSQDRESVLRDIFETGAYLDFQKRLVALGGAGRARVLAAQEECLRAFEALESPTPADKAPEAGGNGEENGAGAGRRSAEAEAAAGTPEKIDPLRDEERARERADEILAAAQGALDEASSRIPVLLDAADRAAKDLARAREDRALLEERGRLLRESQALEAQRPAIEAARERVEAARRVASILPALEQRERAFAARDAAGARALEALGACADAGLLDHRDGPMSEGLARSLSARIEEETLSRSEERSRIRELVALEAGLEERGRSLDEEEARAAGLEERIARFDEALSGIPERLAIGERALEDMSAQIDAREGAEAAAERLRTRMSAAEEALRLIETMKAASEAVGSAKAASREARIAAAIAHEQWLNQTASALAEDLAEGSPCPVCGSPDHPSPASSAEGEEVSREAIAALDRARAQADERFAEASSAHLASVEAVKAANARAGGDAASIRLELEAAEEALEALRRVKGLRAELESDLKKEREREASLKDQRSAARLELAEGRARIASARRALDADARACAEAAGEAESLVGVNEALSAALGQLKAASAALTDFLRLSGIAASAREQALAALEEGGFEDGPETREEIRSQHMAAPSIEALESEISRYDSHVGATRRLLDSDRLKRAEGLEAAEEEPLRRALEEAAERRDEAQRLRGSLERALEHAARLRKAFLDSLERLHGARAEAGPLRRLAGIVDASSKDNLVETPLSAWVLVSRLEEVLAAANPRLAKISSGRYELASTPDDGTRSRRSGLGLAIIDHDTEEARSPLTLSGGETFYTSLSLALGLADVVTAEAGGVELRTMFIDEGFGSLDSATLELVMAQLHELRDSGRVIGVISHVDEMARQIPDRITVRPGGRGGSTLSVSL